MKLVAKDTYYVGVDDHEVDLFEAQFDVPNGMAYNSYVITDEKIAVFDSVGEGFGQEWLAKLDEVLQGRTPDYLIVQHMEPDHSANICLFAQAHPDTAIVATKLAFQFMNNYFGTNFAERALVVGEGDTLCLGAHELTFITANFVHWPEVMFTYDAESKTLFSADAFGKFGALDVQEDWACEARRYYFGIVGKFGQHVQQVLAKLAAYDIQTICALHGPQLNAEYFEQTGTDLGYYLHLYDVWSSYGVESEGVCICYTTVYGHMGEAVRILTQELEAKGVKVAVADLCRDDMAEAMEDAFRYGKLVLATTTYNNGVFPAMHDFINHLVAHAYQNRTIAFMQGGTWFPNATKGMKALLEGQPEITFAEHEVTMKGGIKPATLEQISALAEEIAC